jgi:hypothetical protein
VKRLSRGEELKIKGRKQKWLEVAAGEGIEGWVHGDFVGDPEQVRAAHRKELARRKKPGRVWKKADQARSERTRTETKENRFTLETMLAGLELDVEELDPIGVERRFMGTGSDNEVLEFWGEPERLNRAAIIVQVVDVPEEALNRSGEIAVTFVKNAVPRWKRDGAYMSRRLVDLTRLDKGEGGFDTDGKSVRFSFIKPLGSVRIVIEPEQPEADQES